MYSAFRQLCERLLRIPNDPEPPPGDEASTRVFRATPNFYKYLLFLWVLKSVFAAAVVAALSIGPVVGAFAITKRGNSAGWLLLAIPAFGLILVAVLRLFALAVLRLDFDKRWYVVTDRSLRVREGVISVREMTVTFANIQNILISQGPVQRMLGIANLQVQSAGGGASKSPHHSGPDLHMATLRGIDNAPELRVLIEDRLRQAKDAGLGDPDDQPSRDNASKDSASLISALRAVHHESRLLHETLVSQTRPGALTT